MGGAVRASLNLAAQLARDGYEVEILSLFRGRREPFFGRFPQGVTVTVVDDGRRRPLLRRLLARFPSTLMHPADRAAARCTLWTDVMLVRTLRRRTGFVIGTRAMFNLLLADVSLPGLVTVAQEHMNLPRKARALVASTAVSYPKLHAVVVLTDADLRAYRELLPRPRPRLARIPNGVRELSGPRSPLTAPVVLAAGRLIYQKGFDLLIRAFADVVATHPEWRLRICGHGRQHRSLTRLATELGVAHAIELVGSVKDIGTEMGNASLFVLSSRWEGFPLVLLEAMSKGLAVVSTDCPTGPAEIIEDHRNGILVPPRDAAALAAAMRELIEHEGLRRQCGAGAAQTAAGYSMSAIGAQWRALLRDLWAEAPGYCSRARELPHDAR